MSGGKNEVALFCLVELGGGGARSATPWIWDSLGSDALTNSAELLPLPDCHVLPPGNSDGSPAQEGDSDNGINPTFQNIPSGFVIWV